MILSYLKIIRKLVDHQQFDSLKTNAQRYLDETADIQALPLMALAHAHLGERVAAEAALAHAVAQLQNLGLDARVDLAAVYCLLLRINEAVALLEPALAAQPDHSLALGRMAWCRMKMGQQDVARRLYQRSAELMPDRLPVWSALVRLCLETNDTLAAQQALDNAIARLEVLNAELPQAAVNQFAAQFRDLQLEIWVTGDNIAQAEQWLEECRHALIEDDWVGLMVGYAFMLAGNDRHSEAEEALRNSIRHYPENIVLISQLAELAQLQGRTMQAIHLLRRAIRVAKVQEKPEVNLWVRLSGAWLHQMDEHARKASEKAMELAVAMQESDATPEPMIRQSRLQAKNAMALVESQSQNFDEAKTLFNAVLEENPWFLPALQGLGQQQMQRGRIDEAIALFERIKEIDPAKGYLSLINAHRFPDDVTTLERIEKAARKPSLEGQVRSGLLLQLAAAWEKNKDYDKAFALVSEANNSSKKLLHYDSKAHRQNCARTRHAFCRALFDHRKECGVNSSLPVYVLGMPRSGTTLSEQILAGHSQICGAGELGVIPSRIQGLNRWERHTGSGRRYPDCVDDLSPYVVEGIAQGILQELQEYSPEAKHVVDKLPHNFENIGLIKFFFPNAKIISVRRDPRDIAISNYFTDYQAKHGGMGFAYDLTWIGEQLADHNLMMHHWHQTFPGEILEITYEEVVDDTECMARKMLDYIGVEWEPQVLAFNELERPVKTASVWQVRQPIYKTSKGKWMRYENHLAPLIQGTNAKIEWEPIKMMSLPEPGFLQTGVALYRNDDLDGAELSFKKMLHHNPEHAACNYMVGLIYFRKGYVTEGIPLVEKALDIVPWRKEWRQNLAKAYELAGEDDKLAKLKEKYKNLNKNPDWQGAENPIDFEQLYGTMRG